MAFQGGTSDTAWGLKPAAGSGDCAARALCSAAPGGQGHFDDHSCTSPVTTEPFHTHQNPAISQGVTPGIVKVLAGFSVPRLGSVHRKCRFRVWTCMFINSYLFTESQAVSFN